MSPFELLRLSLGALRAHKLRSILTTLGIMIGVMTVIGMLALIDGLNSLVAAQLSSIGSNTLYIQKFSWVMSRDELIQSRSRPNLTPDDAEALADRLDKAQRVAPILRTFVSTQYGGETLDAVELIGTTADYLYIADFVIEAGRPISPVDVEQNRRVAIIGSTVYRKLFSPLDPLGTDLRIGQHFFRVIAVLQEKGALFGADPDNMVLIPISAYTRLFSGSVTRRGENSVTIAVLPESPEATAQLRDEITGILRRRRRVPPGEENDFNINTADQLMETYRTITAGIFGLMIGVTALSLVVGGIGIMNIMLVSVSERTREIGVRKAVGARRRDILSQFLTEAVTLSIIGGTIGMVLGFLFAWAISGLIHLPAAVSWWSVLLGLGFSAVVGIFFGWYPARRAAGMNPIEALRHE